MEQLLNLQNPWHTLKKVPEKYLGKYKRELTSALIDELSNNKITCLVGPRQAGKTTIMHELINYLINKGIDPTHIFYLQLSEDITKAGLLDKFMEIISDRLSQPIEDIKKIYIFLDEVHTLESWAEELKKWYDLKLNIKFVVSGSSAIRILKGSGESLIGRINPFVLLPLSFREIVNNRLNLNLNRTKLDYFELKSLKSKLSAETSKIQLLFKQFLLRGGYPDSIDRDIEDGFNVLQNYKDLALQRDLFELEEIRDAKSIRDLVKVLASLTTERINYSKIASILGIKMDTAKKYIGLLEDIFLVKDAKVFSSKPYFSVRKERKIEFIDSGMINAIMLQYKISDYSKLVENAVMRGVLERKLKYGSIPDLYYWLDEHGYEVDCILDERAVLPVEVKYAENVQLGELKGLLSFLNVFKSSVGIVVSKDKLACETVSGKEILYVPAWLFLLAV